MSKKDDFTTALNKLNEDERKEYWACLALKYAKNIGIRTISKLMKHFNSAFTAVHSLTEWGTLGLSHKTVGIEDNTWRARARIEWENSKDLEGDIILYTSHDYPTMLKEIPDPPSFFYCMGNKELLHNPCIAIVGSRICSKEGKNISHYFGKMLAKSGLTVVSGMARGIDRAAHYGAMEEIGSTIGVLGSGINVIYPANNTDIYFALKKDALLVSEFPPGTPPDPTFFPIRNRIISGLSHGTLVIEAGVKSGSMITARLAAEQNRTVYTVPGAFASQYSTGCQELSRNGAKEVYDIKDILEDLFPILKHEVAQQSLEEKKEIRVKANKKKEDKTEKKIEKADISKFNYPLESLEYKVIQALANKKLHFDTICQELVISAQELTVLLVQMEMENSVTRHAGAWYSLYEK